MLVINCQTKVILQEKQNERFLKMINFKLMSENVWQSRSIHLHSDLSWSIYKEHLNLDRIYSSYEVE